VTFGIFIRRIIRFKLIKTRESFPNFYYFAVRFLSVILALVKYRTLVFSGKRAHWFLQVQKGKRYLNDFWTPLNSIDIPLRLSLHNVNKIEFPNHTGAQALTLNQFNPCIVAIDNGIQICWRISDIVFHPATKLNGDSLSNPTIGVCNGIGIATIQRNDLLNRATLSQPRILIAANEFERSTLHKIQDIHGRSMDFEDPRFIPEYPHLILMHGRYTGRIPDRPAPRYDIVLFNLESNEIKLLIPQNRHKAEKNWVPICTDNEKHILLRSTKPFAVVAVDKEDHHLSEISWDSADFGEIHNGSNFLLLDEDLYIRVVRVKINLEGLRGVRLNFIMMHNLEFKEVGRTKPFIFNDFGYEICNSITEFEGKIFFAWGMNDSAGYIGHIDRDILQNWIRNHKITTDIS